MIYMSMKHWTGEENNRKTENQKGKGAVLNKESVYIFRVEVARSNKQQDRISKEVTTRQGNLTLANTIKIYLSVEVN